MNLLPRRSVAQRQGCVVLSGREISALSERELQKLRGAQVAMIFQDPMTALNPVLTICVQVSEPLQQHLGLSKQAARQRTIELLDAVGIPDAANRVDQYPHQLSGGMRQRVVIAIALACGPQLLIADEPTTALDVTIQREVLDLIAELVAEDGMGLLLISHDLGVMAQTVRRMLVMYAGTVVESGPTAAVFERLAHPYTHGLFAARPRIGLPRGTRLSTIPGKVPELADMPTGCPFAERCSQAEERCRAADPPNVEVAPGHFARCVKADAWTEAPLQDALA
jgi:peptide/nickel transport system ATP-binding protein